jgi:hypothetical protein
VTNVSENDNENENGQYVYPYQLINEKLSKEYAYTLCLIILVNHEIYPNKEAYLRIQFLCDRKHRVSPSQSPAR